MPGGAGGREVGHDLADDRGELEAVAGETGGHGDLRAVGERGDHEMLVRGVGVHAGLGDEERAVQRRHPRDDRLAHLRDLVLVDRAIDRLGRADAARAGDAEVGDLRAAVRPLVRREAVELNLRLGLPDVDRQLPDRVRRDAAERVEPVHHLALHLQRQAEIAQEVGGPRAGGDDEPRGLVAAARRGDAHALAAGSGGPGGDRLGEMEVGTEPRRAVEVRRDAVLGAHEPGQRLVEGDHVRAGLEDGEAATDVGGVEDFMGQLPLLGAA